MKHWLIWLLSALMLIAGVLVYFSLSSQGRTESYQGTELSGEAPDFQLTNQNGFLVSLSDFRGKVVVLTFMDSTCKDTCPLTAAQFRQASQQLDQIEASQVVFMGVNVNVEANKVAEVAEITKTWHLEEIPSWHFLTGSREDLQGVWKDYGVAVSPSADGKEIMHTPGIFLIDPSGQKRWYISTPFSSGDTDLTLPLSELLLKHIREIRSQSK
jgi:cytochrome oxidase Cu insertion factor (SCO1/SenC/PrrC family)